MTFPIEEKEEEIWTVFVDGSSNSKRRGARVIIENDEGIVIEVFLGLSFAMTNILRIIYIVLTSLMKSKLNCTLTIPINKISVYIPKK